MTSFSALLILVTMRLCPRTLSVRDAQMFSFPQRIINYGLPISANPFAFLTAEIPIQFNPSAKCAQCRGDTRVPYGQCFLDREGKPYCATRNDKEGTRMLALALVGGPGGFKIPQTLEYVTL
ncbi:hypothetical protein Ahy_A09g042071 [Arachis hypogaea]|uniref:Xylanase inhibitor N-terminal domain-containing protein n=1 Tax=Arachis hypogaea TaxID=3818 RepID=A0A445BET5_ARAHY|nr:hypothetical protein Ahy_A09g042071 [Arachis hypogaea]